MHVKTARQWPFILYLIIWIIYIYIYRSSGGWATLTSTNAWAARSQPKQAPKIDYFDNPPDNWTANCDCWQLNLDVLAQFRPDECTCVHLSVLWSVLVCLLIAYCTPFLLMRIGFGGSARNRDIILPQYLMRNTGF